MMGTVDKGTSLRVHKIKRKRGLTLYRDVIAYFVFAEILDGPRRGLTVEISELSIFEDPDSCSSKMAPNPALLAKVGADSDGPPTDPLKDEARRVRKDAGRLLRSLDRKSASH